MDSDFNIVNTANLLLKEMEKKIRYVVLTQTSVAEFSPSLKIVYVDLYRQVYGELSSSDKVYSFILHGTYPFEEGKKKLHDDIEVMLEKYFLKNGV